MLYTLYFASLGGSTAHFNDIPFYRDNLPPLWPAQNEPYDLLTVQSLGLSPKSWLASCLTWPYRTYVGWRLDCKVTGSGVGIIPWRINVGGAGDFRAALAQTRRALAESLPDTRFVLFGRSRGGLVALRVYCALSTTERARIKFVLLEGAFCDHSAVMRAWWPRLGGLWLKLASWFTEWKETKLPAFSFPDNATAPIAVVGSRGDQVISIQETMRLYWLLPPRKSPLLVLDKASHSRYGQGEDGRKYADFIRQLMQRM